MKTPAKNILKWYSGKSLERATAALELLLQSEKEGQWVPKASRSVRAALGKHNVATKIARKMEADAGGWQHSPFDSLRTPAEKKNFDRSAGDQIVTAMIYGAFQYLLKIDVPDLQKRAKTIEGKSALEKVIPYYNDFSEVAQLMATLDATRPPPVFTSLGVSPTVTKTLQDASLDLNTNTIRLCPWEYFKVKVKDKNGNEKTEVWMRLLWPKNTKFNASRFANGMSQCQACGHLIKNPWNWVALLIDNKKGVPHSLWVGRDCAHTVFGIKVTGEIKIEGGKQ